jgi:hypothetical protein
MISGLMDPPTDRLDAALLYAGCPICALRREREMRFVAHVLDDHVVAAMVRAEFMEALGYCADHAWLQQSIEWQFRRDGLTTADMYQYILRRNLDALDIFTWLSRYVRRFQPLLSAARLRQPTYIPAGLLINGRCPICEAGDYTERFRLRMLGERLAEPDFQACYRASDGLCLVHLRQAIAAAHDPQSGHLLIETALARLETTARRLQSAVSPDVPDQAGRVRHLCERTIARLVGSQAATHAEPRDMAKIPPDICPMCAILAAIRQAQLEQALREADSTEPFCARHAWQLYDRAVAQSRERELAAVVGGWTKRAIDQIKPMAEDEDPQRTHANGHQHGSIWARFVSGRRPPVKQSSGLKPPDCPVCRRESAARQEQVRQFVDRWDGVDGRRQLAAAGGLCLPHLREALRLTAPLEKQVSLVTHARDRLVELIHLLGEYERKHIWDYRDEPKLPEEQQAWIRALAFEVGERP